MSSHQISAWIAAQLVVGAELMAWLSAKWIPLLPGRSGRASSPFLCAHSVHYSQVASAPQAAFYRHGHHGLRNSQVSSGTLTGAALVIPCLWKTLPALKSALLLCCCFAANPIGSRAAPLSNLHCAKIEKKTEQKEVWQQRAKVQI